MFVCGARSIVNFVDDFFALDVSQRLAEELIPTPSDEYKGWRREARKNLDKLQYQIYNLILEF
jgi:hypothetical protein